MPTISEAIRQFAEEPESETAEPPLPVRRIVRPTFTLMLSPSPTQSEVTAVRTTVAGLDATISEVRAVLRDVGYSVNVWEVGPSCRPEGLASLLVERGFFPATRPPFEPISTVMALVQPPPSFVPDAGVEARLVRDLDEYVMVLRVAMKAFNQSEEATSAWIAAAPAFWRHYRFTHIAFVDGQPAGFGFSTVGRVGFMLRGGGVLQEARGRGVYRALLAARWAEAVKVGKPALVVHAGAMSGPILKRCGFDVVCRLDILQDPEFR